MHSHFLYRCWDIFNWTLGDKLQRNLVRNLYIFIQENTFQNVVRELLAIFSRPQYVKCSKDMHLPNYIKPQYYLKWIQPCFKKLRRIIPAHNHIITLNPGIHNTRKDTKDVGIMNQELNLITPSCLICVADTRAAGKQHISFEFKRYSKCRGRNNVEDTLYTTFSNAFLS